LNPFFPEQAYTGLNDCIAIYRADYFLRLLRALRLTNHFYVRRLLKYLFQSPSHNGMVIYDDDSDHSANLFSYVMLYLFLLHDFQGIFSVPSYDQN
jgi:hypothetical protein